MIDYEVLKNAVSNMFVDKFSAYVESSVTNELGIEEFKETKVIDNAPCLLTFHNEVEQNEIGTVEVIRKDVITTPPNFIIPNGSRIVVTKSHGAIYNYKFSQKPSLHPSHNRYRLDSEDIT